MIKISENRLVQISWGALGALLVSVVGGVLWLSVIYYTADANAKSIAEIKEDLNVLDSIDNRLSNIEGYIKGKND